MFFVNVDMGKIIKLLLIIFCVWVPFGWLVLFPLLGSLAVVAWLIERPLIGFIVLGGIGLAVFFLIKYKDKEPEDDFDAILNGTYEDDE